MRLFLGCLLVAFAFMVTIETSYAGPCKKACRTEQYPCLAAADSADKNLPCKYQNFSSPLGKRECKRQRRKLITDAKRICAAARKSCEQVCVARHCQKYIIKEFCDP